MMKKLLSLLLAALMLLSCLPALAEAGENASTKEITFDDLLAAAEGGDITAMLQVALAYYQGSDAVEKDYQTAYIWFLKAAKQGHAAGQYNVGVLYMSGVLGEPDYDAALHWLEKAAAQNYEYALINLGAMYASGLGVEQNTAMAEEYYTMAAELGSSTGWLQLGQLRYAGSEPDGKEQAYECFLKAAELDDAQAAYNLGVMTANGEGVEADVNAALVWYTKAADLGLARAQTTVGAYCLGTDGIEADYDKAFHYFSLATQQGDLDGLYFLGMCYEQGFGTELNQESARNCYELAVMMGHQGAAKRLEVLQQMQAIMDTVDEGETDDEQP